MAFHYWIYNGVYGVIHFYDGQDLCVQGDDAIELDKRLEGLNMAKTSVVLSEYWDTAKQQACVRYLEEVS